MKNGIALLSLLGAGSLLLGGCEGWVMDYGKPAAQFHEADVLRKAGDFVGKKIVIKGVVTKVDLGDPESCRVYLDHGIECVFWSKAMAESQEIGDVVYVSGILKKCDSDKILLDPAGYRDPTAPFDPR